MFWKRESVTSLSWVNQSRHYIEAVFKCLFLDIGSEILQFDNASIYVQFGVTFITFFGIYFIYFYPSYEGFFMTEHVFLLWMLIGQ